MKKKSQSIVPKMAPNNNGPRNLKTSEGRRKARAAKFRADPELMGLFANYIVNSKFRNTVPFALIRKLIRTEWVGNNKSLVPYRNGKLNSKITTAFYNANGQKLVNKKRENIEAKKKANAQAKRNAQAKENANERARVNRLKQTPEGRMRLARENANARERALQNNLRHGGHFAAGY